MKRKILTICTFLTLLIAALGIAACGKQHTHAFGEWETDTPATCSALGQQKRTCGECGLVETRPLDKLAHTFGEVWTIEKNPTCLAEGEESRACAVCGAKETRALERTEHSYGSWIVVRAATCSLAGSKVRYCLVCKEAREEDAIEKLSHTPVFSEAVEANCLSGGVSEGMRCAVCGEAISGCEPISALGHSYVAVGEAIEATCEEDGMTAGEKCGRCGEVFAAQERIEKLGHEYTYTYLRSEDSGSEKASIHSYQCNRCEASGEAACALDTQETPATCISPAHHRHTCALCGHFYEHDDGVPLGHSESYAVWVFDEETYENSLKEGAPIRRHIRICTHAGHTPAEGERDTAECTPVAGEKHAPSCAQAGYTDYACEACGAAWTDDRVEPTAHQWENCEQFMHPNLGKLCHRRKCSLCGTYYVNAFVCNVTSTTDEPTCTEAGKTVSVCKDCGGEMVTAVKEALGHSYGAWSHDGATSGAASEHIKTCGRCGDVMREACVMKDASSLPTCHAAGQSIEACETCLYTENKGEIEKLQHVYPEAYTADGVHKTHYRFCTLCGTKETIGCSYEVYKTDEATCTENEVKYYRCPVCKDEYSQVNSLSFGHVVAEWDESDDGMEHSGQCSRCMENVRAAHDYTETNLCAVCGHDGLTYAFVKGTGDTQAMVSNDCLPGYASQGFLAPAIPAKEIVVADTWKGAPVVMIGNAVFLNNTSVERITLPKSLEVISYEAFSGCTALKEVKLAGHNSGEAGIADAHLKRIESGAFGGCTSLTNAVFPESLEYIGGNAFKNCRQLADIVIPERVTEIDANAFLGTAFYEDDTHWTQDVLYINTHLIRAKTTITGAYTVLNTTVSISEEAFKDCASLSELSLPASLKVIDRDAFDGCTALSKVIYAGTFQDYLLLRFDNDKASPMYYAGELTIEGAKDVVEIPESTTAIPAGAFRGSKIRGVIMHANVTSIGAQAFKDCALLEYICIESRKLVSVGKDAFTGSKFYETEENWEDGVLYLKGINGTLPQGANSQISAPAASEDDYLAAVASRPAELNEVTLKDVRVIASEAFKGCAGLTRIVLPATLINIGADAFAGCDALQNVLFTSQEGSWFVTTASGMSRLLYATQLFPDEAQAARAVKYYAGGLKKQ